MTKEKTRGKILAVALAALMIASVLGILSATSGGSNGQSICAAISNEVYLVPQHSSAPFCETADVEIRVNAENFQAGQIKLIYESTCADVTNWVGNTADFPIGTWDSGTSGEEWITFTAMAPLSGDCWIGTLTIHCVSEEECTTALDFIEDPATGSALFDDLGSEIPATWTDGTFQCSVPQLCTVPDPPSNDFGDVPKCETRTWDFEITNCGCGILEWTVSEDEPWITVDPTSSTTTTETDTVTVEISTCDLECDETYTGAITVDSNGGTKTGSITARVICVEKPDLVISEIKCDRENNRVGYEVKNMGGAVASACHDTALWVDDEQVCEDHVDVDLNPEGTYEGWFECYEWLECQTINVKVCADINDEVDESKEDNNCLEGLCSCNEVYLDPQHSRAVPGTTTDVEIRVNATDFMGGQIKLIYASTCANVTNWVRNTADFPLGTWDSDTPGEEWILFTAMDPLSGDYLIGTLTIHCVSEEDCTTALDFIEDPATGSALFDGSGSEIPATWTGGTLECEGLCGDVAPYPDCDYIVNMGDVILLLSYVGHPGEYELCCEFCGDVAPCPVSDDIINMGDVILLLSYVGHPGEYELCCG
jgi:hypothetical protein